MDTLTREQMIAEFGETGVQNPAVVDLITLDKASDTVVLAMIERRPWGVVREQFKQIEEKLNRYLGYALDGFLAEQYPHYVGKPVQIRLDCAEAPHGEAVRFVEAMTHACASHGIRFSIAVAAAAASLAAGPEVRLPGSTGGERQFNGSRRWRGPQIASHPERYELLATWAGPLVGRAVAAVGAGSSVFTSKRNGKSLRGRIDITSPVIGRPSVSGWSTPTSIGPSSDRRRRMWSPCSSLPQTIATSPSGPLTVLRRVLACAASRPRPILPSIFPRGAIPWGHPEPVVAQP